MSAVWLIACSLLGCAIGLAFGVRLTATRHRRLPPATARQLERAARANRADLRAMRLPADKPAVSQRLESFETLTVITPGHSARTATPLPTIAEFDEEVTEV